jgi:hypothetical protein
MRQIAQNYKTGEVRLVEVPVPACRPGGVVVRSEFSLISAGTELMKVAEAKMSPGLDPIRCGEWSSRSHSKG